MRVLHFSDIHLPLSLRSVPIRDWLSKRSIGGLNLLLGRAACFVDGFEKIAALDRFRQEIAADFVICTGDYTALGTRGEMRRAREAVQPLMHAPLGYANVPGNHDFYAFDFLRKKQAIVHFQDNFSDTFTTDLPQYAAEEGLWPFVRLVGDDVAVIGVNSSRPNLPWRSSGRIPSAQMTALRSALADDALRDRFVFVITHYAARLRDGSPDRRLHGLVNAEAFLEVCADVPRGALLSGHIHRRYSVRIDGVKPTLFCAGSATMAGREGLWVFDIQSDTVRATPGTWDAGRYVLETDASVEL